MNAKYLVAGLLLVPLTIVGTAAAFAGNTSQPMAALQTDSSLAATAQPGVPGGDSNHKPAVQSHAHQWNFDNQVVGQGQSVQAEVDDKCQADEADKPGARDQGPTEQPGNADDQCEADETDQASAQDESQAPPSTVSDQSSAGQPSATESQSQTELSDQPSAHNETSDHSQGASSGTHDQSQADQSDAGEQGQTDQLSGSAGGRPS